MIHAFQVAHATTADIIAPAALIPSLWHFGRHNDGAWLSQRARFLPDGRIVGVAGTNEARWRLEDGALFLTGQDGTDTTRLDRWETIARRRVLTGPFLLRPDVQHVLLPNHADLQTVRWLRDPTRPVLVIFNNVGAPFDGVDTRWALFRFIETRPVDHVRFAERADPAFWFLNKIGRIMATLRDLVALGYREIALYGTSSGGYAAILFGELLAAEFPQVRVRTVALNPQVVHGADHEAAVRAITPFINLPAFIEPDALSQSETPTPGIPDLVRGLRRGDVEHRVLFDEANEAEHYYASFIRPLPGFDLRARPFGLPHPEGILALRESDQPEALEWALAP